MISHFQIFTDGSDLEGVAHPRDIRYIRYVRYWLCPFSAWPHRAAGEQKTTFATFFSYVNFTVAMFGCISYSFYIWNHVGILSFFELGLCYIVQLMSTVSFTRQCLMLTERYEKCISQFLNEVHLFHHRHISDYADKMHFYIHKLSHFFSIYSIGLMFWGMILFNAIPLYNNAQAGRYSRPPPENVTYEHSLYLALPFDYEHNFKGYMAGFVLDCYFTVRCSVMFCILDLLLALQMFHLWGNLKILIHNLENFPRPAAGDRYTDTELKDVCRRLREIVVHHNLILNNTNTISTTFGSNIGVYYVFHQISGCVLLYECSTLELKSLIRFGPLTLILLQLQVQMSAVFELVSAMTDRLIRAAYSPPWELIDVANRRSTLIILAQCQRPLGLKAVGMVEVGMKTTITILKTTISYFLMLITMTKDLKDDATS